MSFEAASGGQEQPNSPAPVRAEPSTVMTAAVTRPPLDSRVPDLPSPELLERQARLRKVVLGVLGGAVLILFVGLLRNAIKHADDPAPAAEAPAATAPAIPSTVAAAPTPEPTLSAPPAVDPPP